MEQQYGGLPASSAGPQVVDLMRWIDGPIARVAAHTVVLQPSVLLADSTTAGMMARAGFETFPAKR